MYNKKAKFNYELLDKFTAGIMLNGREVKAIREDKLSFGDSFCVVSNGGVFLKKLHISIKDAGESETMRDRKLLLNRKEIEKLDKSMREKGLTIVPIGIYVNKTGLIKVDIHLARGKNAVNKKESIKEKDLKREQSKGL